MTTLESPGRLGADAVQHTPPQLARTSIPVKVVGAKHHVAGALVPVRVDRDGTSYFPVGSAVLQAASRADGTGQRALATFGELVAAKVLTSVSMPGLGTISRVAQNPGTHGIDLLAVTTSGHSVAIEVKMTARVDPVTPCTDGGALRGCAREASTPPGERVVLSRVPELEEAYHQQRRAHRGEAKGAGQHREGMAVSIGRTQSGEPLFADFVASGSPKKRLEVDVQPAPATSGGRGPRPCLGRARGNRDRHPSRAACGACRRRRTAIRARGGHSPLAG